MFGGLSLSVWFLTYSKSLKQCRLMPCCHSPFFCFHLPDVLVGYFAISFDGTTFLLVFSPACTLAGSVTVMSEFALATPLELLLSAETAVANTLCQAVDRRRQEDREQKRCHELLQDVYNVEQRYTVKGHIQLENVNVNVSAFLLSVRLYRHNINTCHQQTGNSAYKVSE